MPFYNKQIEYQKAQSPYPQDYINQITQDANQILNLKLPFVGVHFCFSQEDYDAFDVPELKSATTYCIMVKKAMQGMASKSKLEHHKCDGGTTALGLEKSTERIESGQEYFSYHLYDSNTAARRMRNSIVSLHHYQPVTYGIVLQPLAECTRQPDVILGVVNGLQAMRLVQGYEYFSGEKPQIDLGAMQAFCSELTAVPYLSGKMNLSVMCPSTRVLCQWDASDLAVGIPFHQYESILRGVIATELKK